MAEAQNSEPQQSQEAGWLTPARSSSIKRYRYDTETKVLTVTFLSGGSYDYHDVPADLVGEFSLSDAPGKFHHLHIKSAFHTVRHSDGKVVLDRKGEAKDG